METYLVSGSCWDWSGESPMLYLPFTEVLCAREIRCILAPIWTKRTTIQLKLVHNSAATLAHVICEALDCIIELSYWINVSANGLECVWRNLQRVRQKAHRRPYRIIRITGCHCGMNRNFDRR
jgi:hypothetical protein